MMFLVVLLTILPTPWSPTLDGPITVAVGNASTFGPVDPGMNNGKLACGGDEWEDTSLPICAHRTLPCGTWVSVRNLRNGKQTWCKVMDRGPYGKLSPEGEWFNGALYPDHTGTFRSILDMGPVPSGRINKRGIERVRIKVWRNKLLDDILDALLWRSSTSTEISK